jgi:hypothetical protein
MVEGDVGIVDLIADVHFAAVRICMNWIPGLLDGPDRQLWVEWIDIPGTNFYLCLPCCQAGSTDSLSPFHWRRNCSSCQSALLDAFWLTMGNVQFRHDDHLGLPTTGVAT